MEGGEPKGKVTPEIQKKKVFTIPTYIEVMDKCCKNKLFIS